MDRCILSQEPSAYSNFDRLKITWAHYLTALFKTSFQLSKAEKRPASIFQWNIEVRNERKFKSEKKEILPEQYCCLPCTIPLNEECGTCNHCKDKPKYGGLGVIKQKCVLRMCVKMKTK